VRWEEPVNTLDILSQSHSAWQLASTTALSSEKQTFVSSNITNKTDTPRYLITLDVGIGDAIAIGLSAVEQIVLNDPTAWGTIDVLCNPLQAQIFAHDPRINKVIATNIVFFPGTHPTEWLQCIIFNKEQTELLDFLRERHYEAVFLSIVAPGLYYRLGSRLMYPSMREMARAFFAVRQLHDTHVSKVARQMVNHYFRRPEPLPAMADEPLLYLSSKEIQKGRAFLTDLKAQAKVCTETSRVLLVAADTATDETRPSTHLLMNALKEVLNRCSELIVCTLPGYTTVAAERLVDMLAPCFVGRIFQLAAEPRPTLLETAALIDQADVFLTGDTGVMHLAAARKALPESEMSHEQTYFPTNAVNIIVLFGGTNPAFFGYKKRTTILGQGRIEQRAIKPGLSKAGYRANGRDFFDHISPREIVDAIVKQMG
jgi:ADP-heptose:LPS heptosyltransferase